MARESQKRYSDYYHQLQQDTKQRYNAKLDSVDVHIDDPYTFRPGNAGNVSMPEWYTRAPSPNTELVPDMQQPESSQTTNNPDTPRKWCYCNEEEFGKMICCDYEHCSIQWFHVKCLRLKTHT